MMYDGSCDKSQLLGLVKFKIGPAELPLFPLSLQGNNQLKIKKKKSSVDKRVIGIKRNGINQVV